VGVAFSRAVDVFLNHGLQPLPLVERRAEGSCNSMSKLQLFIFKRHCIMVPSPDIMYATGLLYLPSAKSLS
jgi:hypothetical protein